jgi:hypothetical protein
VHEGEGVAWLGAVLHVPFAAAPSAAEQTSHEPLQAVSQQKPSTQLPEEHSVFRVQLCPFGSCGTQLVALQ